jgi:hypothetical protein
MSESESRKGPFLARVNFFSKRRVMTLHGGLRGCTLSYSPWWVLTRRRVPLLRPRDRSKSRDRVGGMRERSALDDAKTRRETTGNDGNLETWVLVSIGSSRGRRDDARERATGDSFIHSFIHSSVKHLLGVERIEQSNEVFSRRARNRARREGDIRKTTDCSVSSSS